MTTDQLKDLLSEMADEVTPTSLHQRAAAQSRRSTMRRAVVASVAVVALAGGGIVGATTIPGGGNDRVDGAAATNRISGTFHVSDQGEDGTDADLSGVNSWTPGAEPPEEVLPLGTDDGDYVFSADLSPDGEYLSYRTVPSDQGADESNASKIKIRNLETDTITEVAAYSDYDKTCSEPTWAPDGERLFIDRGKDFGDERFGFVDAETMAFTPIESSGIGCGVKVATGADDRELLYSWQKTDRTVDVNVTDEEGKTVRTSVADVVADTSQSIVTGIGAVSEDGRYACVGTSEYEDNARDELPQSDTCDQIVDLKADKAVDIPMKQEQGPESEHWSGGKWTFAVPGRLLIEAQLEGGTEVLRMYDFTGTRVDQVEIPADFAPIDFLPGKD